MNFITCKLNLSGDDYRERQALEENGGQLPLANKWKKSRKTAVDRGHAHQDGVGGVELPTIFYRGPDFIPLIS